MRCNVLIILLLGIAVLLGGCASPDISRVGNKSVATPKSEKTQADISRPEKPARVSHDKELGFTITESIRISGNVRNAYMIALQLLENADSPASLNTGIKALENVVEEAPELTAPHIDLGIAYTRIGEMKKAEASFKKAIFLTPDHPVAHNELGILYRKTGRFQLARQSYEQALRIVDDFHYAQRNLGVLCDLFLQDLTCALTQYEAYQRAFPDDRDVEIWLADVRNRLNVQ